MALHPLDELDERMTKAMFAFARRLDDWEPWDAFAVDLDAHPTAALLFVPWALYEYVPPGGRVAERFDTPIAREAAWLHAQKRASLRAWEILEVELGRSLRLRDPLTKEERVVPETRMSCVVARGETLLARVVDFEGVSVVMGMHPRALPIWIRETITPGPAAVDAWERILTERRVPVVRSRRFSRPSVRKAAF
jgi:hypothetical protein